MKKITNALKTIAVLAPAYAISALPAFAEDVVLNPSGNFEELGGITFPKLVSTAIGLIMLVVALVFFFMLIWGGLRWVMSQGEEKAVGAAKAQITNALIGLAIVFSAWAIMQLIKTIFGIDIFTLTIPSITD